MTQTSTTHHTNGTSQERIAETLEDEVTLGYRPVMPLEALWLSGTDMPQVTLRRDLEFMQLHPIVMTALEYYKSGIAGAEFWGGKDLINPDNPAGRPVSQDLRVSQFVLEHVDRFWNYGMPILQEGGYPYGWAPGEHIYKEVGGLMTWSHLKGFLPNDGYILTTAHHPVGIRIKNIKEKMPVDLWFSAEAIPAKACWYAHRPRFNQFYGRSQLIGAWRPWRRLGWRDAVEQVIDAAIYRAGYKGPIVRHPPEDMQTSKQGVPATALDGQGNPRRAARDVARQMVEWAKAGAGFTMSSAKYPTSQGGGNKWDLEWPDHVMDVRPLIEAAFYLQDQIILGIGVPPELIKAGGTGSGYSGRSIPREAFLDGQQKVADAMLRMFVEQVVSPLVMWNFGPIPFNVECKSLLATQSGDRRSDGAASGPGFVNPNRSRAAHDAWDLRKQGQGIAEPSYQTPTGAPAPTLSIDPEYRKRVLDLAYRALRRLAA